MNPTMGRLETWAVNSSLRAFFARREIMRFRQMTKLAPGGSLLEVGCGAGLTTAAIIAVFRPERVCAFDFADEQVERARRRLGSREDVEVRQADATAMPYADGSFDAVVEVGILHHISRWREVLPEVRRVLRPTGAFCFAEPTKGRLSRGMYRVFPHPREAMFERDELLAELRQAGLEPRTVSSTFLWNIFGFAVKSSARRD